MRNARNNHYRPLLLYLSFGLLRFHLSFGILTDCRMNVLVHALDLHKQRAQHISLFQSSHKKLSQVTQLTNIKKYIEAYKV